MKQICFLIAILFLVSSCQKDKSNFNSPERLLPQNADVVFKINELSDFIATSGNQKILSQVYKNDISKSYPVLKELNPSHSVFIAFLNSGEDYLIVTENDSTLFSIDSLPNHISEKIKNVNIDKIQIDSLEIYAKVYGSVFAASNNYDVIKNLKPSDKNYWEGLLKTTSTKSVASLVFDSETPDYSKFLFSQGFNNTYSILDFEYDNNDLNYNGIITPKDTSKTQLGCFNKTIPQDLQSINIAPSNTKQIQSITYDNFAVFNENLNTYNNKPIDSLKTFLDLTNEVALIDNTIVISSPDAELVLETIEEKSFRESFRDIDIYNFESADFFEHRLLPFISYKDAKLLTQLNNFIIFSNDIEAIKTTITSFLNDNVLSKTDNYAKLNEQMSDQASLFIFKNSERISDLFSTSMNSYNANAVQFIYEDGYAHINGNIQSSTKARVTNSVSESFSTSFDSPIIVGPQTVKNHINRAHDIIVQDVNNILYLMSSSGNILWKKQLQEKVLGKVEQIDMFKNGRLQLAFATSNRLYVLDRNGNDVSPFPKKFNDEITQPLSVFDYDKRKNYRFVVTQGKQLLMYDAKGNSVNGFNYQNNDQDIKTQPKHFRIGSKDYIAFVAGENLEILNRQGKTRIDVKDKIRYSENELYLYQNKFTSTNTLGELVQVDTRGKVTNKNLNLTDKHNICTTSKTLVTMTDNVLKIKSRRLELDYGEYTKPKIYYLNDKIYVTTTDLQSKKVYLFDSQAKSISNFPVFGTSAATLEKLDKEKGLELITKADDKTIIVYKLY